MEPEEDERYFLEKLDFQVEKVREEDKIVAELANWFKTIDILKHILPKDISRVFSDGGN